MPVSVLSKKIAAKFRDALKKAKPTVFAGIPASLWHRQWVSFCKPYEHGNNAVLNYLSRYVFRTAISNARILRMDQTHVTFRWKDRDAGTWRTLRLPGVEFLRRFLRHVLPRGFHKVRYYGLWHHSKRHFSSRAWSLLLLDEPTDAVGIVKIADLIEPRGQLIEIGDGPFPTDEVREVDRPTCPQCGNNRTRLLAECSRFGVP